MAGQKSPPDPDSARDRKSNQRLARWVSWLVIFLGVSALLIVLLMWFARQA